MASCSGGQTIASISVGGNKFLVDGEVAGSTLILTNSDGTTVNIDVSTLTGGGTIDFANLLPSQRAALLAAIRGDAVLDLAGNLLGYLVPPV